MKKQTCWFMLIGALCIGFTSLTRSVFTVPESISDFIKGFGIAVILSTFILEVRRKRSCKTDAQ
jgi:ribose/xylose/arabinose/galactoside ABC-type transport system permease subunit